ncbi:MAG: hypothetical protein U0470_14325 [Anaerolineae bacterium]
MALIAGTVLSWIGIALMDRWVAVPKAEDALAGALADVGPHYTLYNWALPQADHVLIAPWGLVVLHPFNTEGPLAVDGKRWRDHRALAPAAVLRPPRDPQPGPLVSADAVALRAAQPRRWRSGRRAMTFARAAPTAAARVADPLADVPIATAIVFTRRTWSSRPALPDPPTRPPSRRRPARVAAPAGRMRRWRRRARRR